MLPVLLAFCDRNPPVTGKIPPQRTSYARFSSFCYLSGYSEHAVYTQHQRETKMYDTVVKSKGWPRQRYLTGLRTKCQQYVKTECLWHLDNDAVTNEITIYHSISHKICTRFATCIMLWLTYAAIRRHKTWSVCVQVMLYCLIAPSHYLNQCHLLSVWFFAWHSSGVIITRSEDTNT